MQSEFPWNHEYCPKIMFVQNLKLYLRKEVNKKNLLHLFYFYLDTWNNHKFWKIYVCDSEPFWIWLFLCYWSHTKLTVYVQNVINLCISFFVICDLHRLCFENSNSEQTIHNLSKNKHFKIKILMKKIKIPFKKYGLCWKTFYFLSNLEIKFEFSKLSSDIENFVQKR